MIFNDIENTNSDSDFVVPDGDRDDRVIIEHNSTSEDEVTEK